jgi:hypothetical protein
MVATTSAGDGMSSTSDVRYPVGTFAYPTGALTARMRATLVEEIAVAPMQMRAAIAGLQTRQLDTPYRLGGWTVRQLVHHVADNHVDGYLRFKRALTEDVPMLAAHNEAMWAALPDSTMASVKESLTLFEMANRRLVVVLRSMTPSAFLRELKHPAWSLPLTLDAMLALYAWHGRHHIAHVAALRRREGW